MSPIDWQCQVQERVRGIAGKLTPEKTPRSPVLVQEEAGLHVGISADLTEAARHAARIMKEKYRQWLEQDRFSAWGQYRRNYFTVAVGGGNTLKAQYQAMLDLLHTDIDWIGHVRFFVIEESSGEQEWESAEQSLIMNFIVPLAAKLIRNTSRRALVKRLQLPSYTDEDGIIDAMISSMVHGINLSEAKQALDAGNRRLAVTRAQAEAKRYQLDIQHKLGATMKFHYIASGIGKNGTLGALAPYMPELRIKEAGAIVLKQDKGALRVALNRGVLINADCISLIVSGSLKLQALGRFEMEETADFEQTVMETPLRMLRENHDIAEKVYIFADEQSLHFDVTEFRYTEKGEELYARAETREGQEANGPHILLLHGFMGLFSFTNFLVRLPSAWTVSALHRGSHAKKLENDAIFAHYANALRQVMVNLWSDGRVTPIAGHSIAGVILDHLLLTLVDDYDAPIKPYAKLRGDDRKLVDALRAAGIIHLATWAPTDGLHAGKNIQNLISHFRLKTDLDYSGHEKIYREADGQLFTTEDNRVSKDDSLNRLDRFLDTRLAEPLVNGVNVLMRSLLNRKSVQQGMLNTNSPYVLRLIGNRLLKTASFYGMCKEINAAMHEPIEYQRRHLRTLDIMVEYDIPFLSIVHEDDFLVSAKRHKEEYDYLVTRRKKKEGVSRVNDLKVTTRYTCLKRAQDELPLDPLNPHLMIMATSNEGNTIARQITGAITRFVNENIDRATGRGKLKRPASVKKWIRENQPRRKSRQTS